MTSFLFHGHPVTVGNEAELRLVLSCLGLPTPEEVAEARAAMLAERAASGLLFNDEGRSVGELDAA